LRVNVEGNPAVRVSQKLLNGFDIFPRSPSARCRRSGGKYATEAEAVAFVVGKGIGLETGRASASYIQLCHGNAALLTESLEVIRKTSALILAAIENPAADAAEEPEPELAQAS
jgi:hypothetical protein